MKRLLLTALFITTLLAPIAAEKVKIGNLYYALDHDKKTAEVTYESRKNNGDYVSGSLTIPKIVTYGNTNFNVTAIEYWAFAECKGLTSVTIPNSVTKIGDYAFYKCSGLTTVNIPNSVTRLGSYAFGDCTGLSSVIIPNSVTSMGSGTFDGCIAMTSVTIPNSVTYISSNAFKDCRSLPSITIPNSVTEIRWDSFRGCYGLTSVTIPNSVKLIDIYAFSECYGLTSVTIPNSVTEIKSGAFKKCGKLPSVTIPPSVTCIGKDVFEECNNLKRVFLLNPNLDISNNVFSRSTEIIRSFTWKDFNDRLLTWEQYYQQNKKATMSLSSVEEIQSAVNKEIEAWQKKGEFESTAEWQQRVNEKTRLEKINSLSKTYIDQYNNEKNNIEAEQQQLMQSYEQYKKEKLDEYYEIQALIEESKLNVSGLELKPYDADNNTFLISSSTYGDILLPVSREEAPGFKDNWEAIKGSVRHEYVPNGETVALNKIIFTNGDKEYVYDSHTQGKYSVTDIDYNFKPVEIADISMADLNIGGSLPQQEVSSKVVSKSASESLTPRKVEAGQNRIAATDRSDVDYAIPQVASDKNSTTYAVIIANENYKTLSKVPYAINDGEVLEKYLTSAVGLPKNHVKVYKNASVGSMAEAVNYMESLAKAFGDKLNLIFYYAGHGVPDESTKNALILPVDGNPAIPKTCYAVDELIKGLGELRANNVVVLLDACFSGATRNDDMLVAARGIKLKTNDVSPVGNMVLLSATQGDETAYPFEKEGHGLFTYFLLKKLQENKGNVTLGELADYIIENVKQTSIVNNGKLQTPTVTVSPSLTNTWRNIQLK